MFEISDEAVDELEKHLRHFCSLGKDPKTGRISFGCVQCQVGFFDIDREAS